MKSSCLRDTATRVQLLGHADATFRSVCVPSGQPKAESPCLASYLAPCEITTISVTTRCSMRSLRRNAENGVCSSSQRSRGKCRESAPGEGSQTLGCGDQSSTLASLQILLHGQRLAWSVPFHQLSRRRILLQNIGERICCALSFERELHLGLMGLIADWRHVSSHGPNINQHPTSGGPLEKTHAASDLGDGVVPGVKVLVDARYV